MSNIGSSSFYFDLLDSPFCRQCIPPEDLDEVKRLLDAGIDEYDNAMSSVDVMLEEEHVYDTKDIEKLENESSKKLDQCLDKIDLILSLYLYTKEQGGKGSPLTQKLIGRSQDFQASQDEQDLLQKLETWRLQTNDWTERAWTPNTGQKSTDPCAWQVEKAKRWLTHVSKPQRVPKIAATNNRVYFLFKERTWRGYFFPSLRPVAVLKGCKARTLGKSLRLASAQLEVMMYRVGNIFGFSRFFVQTKMEVIKTKDRHYEGSIQPFIKGDHIEDRLKEGFVLLSDEVFCDALLATLGMGMADQHAKNVLFVENEEGGEEPVSFDNNRSMMHSNGVVMRSNGRLMGSYRTCLFFLPQAFCPMDNSIKERIKIYLQTFQYKKGELEAELIQTKASFSFPDHWLEVNEAMQAFDERVANMQENVDQCQTPIDLAFAADPIFKYLTFLRIALAYKSDGGNIFYDDDPATPISERDMACAFRRLTSEAWCIELLMQRCCDNGINPKEIYKISRQQSPWKDWIRALTNYVVDSEKKDQKVSLDDYIEMHKYLVSMACKDFKDEIHGTNPIPSSRAQSL